MSLHDPGVAWLRARVEGSADPTRGSEARAARGRGAQDGAAEVPTGRVRDRLARLTGHGNPEKWSNIMSLIGKSEHDDTRWWRDAKGKSVYGYAEPLKYDQRERGVTMGLVGFTTHHAGKPNGDAWDLYREYRRLGGDPKTADRLEALSRSANRGPASELVGLVRRLEKDPKWVQAQWNRFIDAYVAPSAQILKKAGVRKPSALSLAAVVDASINQGVGGRLGAAAIAKRVGRVQDDGEFLRRFSAAREPTASQNGHNSSVSNARNRVRQFVRLLELGEADLVGADRAIAKITGWKMN